MRTIQMTCSRCNATMFLEKNRGFSSLSCPYCGGKLLLVESDRVKIEEIRADTDRFGMALNYRTHRDHLAADVITKNFKGILIAAGVLLALILIAVNSIRTKDNIRVPFSSRDLNNKNYYTARTMLQDAGFSDIELIAQRDLWDGFLHNDQGNNGKVAQITINGDMKFGENDAYHKSSKIRIWYHAYP